MKYDVLHLPGPPTGGCGRFIVEHRLDEGHEKGDRIKIACKKCGRFGTHEIRAPLKGLERMETEA